MSESLSLRFLYRTLIGRSVLKVLVNPKISQIAGDFLDSKASRCLIPLFIKKNNIDLKGIAVPNGGFKSFNQCFARKKIKAVQKPLPGQLISPCDAYLTCIPIKENSVFDVKHTQFTVGDMLKDKKLEKEFEDGYALIFRLTPAHYHRYCYSVSGRLLANRKIKGILHCVRPIVTRQYPVFAQNSREYQVYDTALFGKVVQMEVGALLVGRITNKDKKVGDNVKVGKEKGYFEYGGSTIILLLQKESVEMKNKFRVGLDEVSVKMGDVIAELK